MEVTPRSSIQLKTPYLQPEDTQDLPLLQCTGPGSPCILTRTKSVRSWTAFYKRKSEPIACCAKFRASIRVSSLLGLFPKPGSRPFLRDVLPLDICGPQRCTNGICEGKEN